MDNFFLSLMPMGIFIGAIFIAGAVMDRVSRKPKDRRSPLTRHLLRSPGHSLMIQVEDIRSDILATIMILSIMPVLFYSMFISGRYFGPSRPGDWTPYIYVAAALGIVVYFSMRLRRSLKERNALRLGLDCEMAVGQELNLLMLEGYHVFHDVPAEGFNIDHVAVGANGVFAVETKGRSKPDRHGGKEDATVIFDGEGLKFPLSIEKEPLIQARRQANYLNKWLSAAMAEPVPVHPVLALPGWFIERKKWGDVLLLNGKDYRVIATQKTTAQLSDTLVRRISHRLEELCRDVKPGPFAGMTTRLRQARQ
jgi:hypothetical protein